MQYAGILLGLGAAFFQSASYVFSRLYVIRGHGAVPRLLLSSHLMMGAASVILLPFLHAEAVPPFGDYVLPLAGASGFYGLGQMGLFMLLRRTEMSRVAPLLGFKIVILAVIASLFLGQPLSSSRWLAVAIGIGATLVLRTSGKRLSWRDVGWVVFVCLAYSLSDLHIAWLVRSLEPLNKLHASAYGACLSYVMCGVVALAFTPFVDRKRVWIDWQFAAPFSACWFLGMILLFACFGYVGTVFGNILQSTRGILSVMLAAMLAHSGIAPALETRMPRGVLLRRTGAAVLMCVAIWLYVR